MLNRKLFLDLDGVIVDFFNAAPVVTDGEIYENMFTLLQRQDGGNLLLEKGKEFWYKLEWISDGKILWDYVKQFNPYILSAYPHSEFANSEHREFAIYGKMEGVKKHLGEDVARRTIVCHKDEKQLFAKDNILIDDYKKNIMNGENSGGIGILHTDSYKTIVELIGGI